MYKVRFDGNGTCLGPAIYCDQCHELIETDEMETSILTWRTLQNMEGVKDVIALFLHNDCIATYAIANIKPYRTWQCVKISELTKEKITIYTL